MSSFEDYDDCNAPGCFNQATIKCGRCRIARYCSKECQKNDWVGHEHPHKEWCFDAANPNHEELDTLVEACLDRHLHEEGEENNSYIGEEAHEKIAWLGDELEDPYIGEFLRRTRLKLKKGYHGRKMRKHKAEYKHLRKKLGKKKGKKGGKKKKKKKKSRKKKKGKLRGLIGG